MHRRSNTREGDRHPRDKVEQIRTYFTHISHTHTHTHTFTPTKAPLAWRRPSDLSCTERRGVTLGLLSERRAFF
jgi:hypothetical protein